MDPDGLELMRDRLTNTGWPEFERHPLIPIASLLGLALLCSMTPIALAQDRSLLGSATSDEVKSLIGDLGHPVYATRQFATRRLCVVGAEAIEPLREAAQGEDIETSLRARSLLATLEQLWFSGVDVRLDVSNPRLEWNESVDVVITLTNRSRYEARVPFTLEVDDIGSPNADARQVADLLDAAEWLKVRADGGREIELRLDNVADDPEVLSVVQERLEGGPSSVIPAGEQRIVRVRKFNRGWARFPLLDAGEYTVVLEYAPDWTDPILAAHRVSRVTSNEARLTVTRPAPEAVSRGGAEAELSVRREGKVLVAALTNRTDLTLYVNTNFGSALPFAEGRWIVESGERRSEIATLMERGRTWLDFRSSGIKAVDAGETIELARLEAVEVEQAKVKLVGGQPEERATITFSYASFCDRRWQAREQSALDQDAGAPEVLKQPLPRRMLSTRITGNVVDLGDAP